MHSRFKVLAFVLFVSATAGAENPRARSDDAFPRGTLVEEIACLGDATQTYTLYLPSAFSEDRAWPTLFVFDPRGRSVAAAEIFVEAAERYGWVVLSSNNTRSDGPWEPNFKAVAAMAPDLERYSPDRRRTYAAGFSGGAVLAWIVGQQTKELAGVIASGGRPLDHARPDTEVPFAHFGAAGRSEFNYEPTRELDAIAAKLGAPHRFESFPGPHRWMPSELALEAVEWMELQAMRAGTRGEDVELIGTLYAKDLAKAEALERSGERLEAQRRYDAIVRTFDGLHDVDAPRRKSTELLGSATVKKALADEKKARRFESTRLTQNSRTLVLLGASDAEIDAGRLATDLRLVNLQDAASEESARGLAAQRVLSSLNSQLSFYMPRDYFANNDYARAAAVLEVSTRIDGTRSRIWYNLASARARSGKPTKAIDALERAVETGYRDLDHMEQDPDLDPLRRSEGYARIVARLRALHSGADGS